MRHPLSVCAILNKLDQCRDALVVKGLLVWSCTTTSTHHKELLGGGDEASIADNGLKDDSSNLPLVGRKQLLDGVDVVIGGGEGGGSGALGHT